MLKDDSLAAIDKDLRDVVGFCVSSGLDSGQIARGASPLLAAARNSRRRAWTKRVITVSVAFAVIAFLFQNVWTYRWICVLGKSVAVKVIKTKISEQVLVHGRLGKSWRKEMHLHVSIVCPTPPPSSHHSGSRSLGNGNVNSPT